MHIAASVPNNTKTIALLVGGGGKINAKSIIKGHEAIHVAVLSNSIENIKALLEKGADIESRDLNGKTPFSLAVWAYSALWSQENSLQIIKYFLNQNVDVTTSNFNGKTVLFILANYNKLEAAELLINQCKRNKEIDLNNFINIKDNDGYDALDFALYNGHKKFARFLMLHGSKIDQSNRLHRAVRDCNLTGIKLLIELGININTQDSQGNTALHLAVQTIGAKDVRTSCFNEIIKTLLKNGAKINIKNKNDKTAFDVAKNLIKVTSLYKHLELQNNFIKYFNSQHHKNDMYFTVCGAIGISSLTSTFFLPPIVCIPIVASCFLVISICFYRFIEKMRECESLKNNLTGGETSIKNDLSNCANEA